MTLKPKLDTSILFSGNNSKKKKSKEESDDDGLFKA